MNQPKPMFSIEPDVLGSGDCIVLTLPDGTRITVTTGRRQHQLVESEKERGYAQLERDPPEFSARKRS